MFSEMYISAIASTSSGNCVAIWNNTNTILIDCGLGINKIKSNLVELGVNINSTKGVFLTHLHHDHVKTSPIKFFCKNNIPIFCHKDMKEALIKNFPFLKNSERYGKLVVYNESSVVGNFFVSTFDVPHDSQGGCKGFNIYSRVKGRVKKISISTDLSHTNAVILERFTNSDVIMIESNYDVEMLENSKRSHQLKERIKTTGHLSNDQSAKSVSTMLMKSRRKAKTIILAHISQECNKNELALKCMREKIMDVKHCDNIKIVETFKDKRSQTVVVE